MTEAHVAGTGPGGEMLFVIALLAAVAVAMASNKLRFDLIALLVVLALILSGVLTVGEALSGFGNSVVIVVAGLLIVGEMLERTGVARAVGDWILDKGGTSETRLLVVVMASAALLGAIMSSTAVVAIFIPIVLRIAAQTGHAASRMLLPMSYAALISGMITLIATPPNLVVSSELEAFGHSPLSFFSFAPIGIAVLAVAIGYVLLLGRKLLPGESVSPGGANLERPLMELWEDFRVDRDILSVQVEPGSVLIGTTIADAEIGSRYDIRVLGIGRHRGRDIEHLAAPTRDTEFHAGDHLLLMGSVAAVERLAAEEKLATRQPTEREMQRWRWEMGAASVLIHPESRLIGRTLREEAFRSRFNVDVVGMRRTGEAIVDFEDVKLASADSLLVVGRWTDIERLRERNHEFVMLEMPRESTEVVPAYRRRPVALGILVAMVLLTVFDVVPLVVAVIIAVIAAVTTRCLSAEDAYRSIHWSSIILIAGMFPLADALQKTGATTLMVEALLGTFGDSSPSVLLTVMFFLTAGLGLFLSNTASAVLVAPIAISAAASMGLSPYPFAIAVLVAASAAYTTPFSTPVVTLVVEPGRYSFGDFLKVGLPLLLLTYLVTLFLAPVFFPWAPP